MSPRIWNSVSQPVPEYHLRQKTASNNKSISKPVSKTLSHSNQNIKEAVQTSQQTKISHQNQNIYLLEWETKEMVSDLKLLIKNQSANPF